MAPVTKLQCQLMTSPQYVVINVWFCLVHWRISQNRSLSLRLTFVDCNNDGNDASCRRSLDITTTYKQWTILYVFSSFLACLLILYLETRLSITTKLIKILCFLVVKLPWKCYSLWQGYLKDIWQAFWIRTLKDVSALIRSVFIFSPLESPWSQCIKTTANKVTTPNHHLTQDLINIQ